MHLIALMELHWLSLLQARRFCREDGSEEKRGAPPKRDPAKYNKVG